MMFSIRQTETKILDHIATLRTKTCSILLFLESEAALQLPRVSWLGVGHQQGETTR